METVWRFLKKLRRELPYNPTISPPGIYPKNLKIKIWKVMCTPIFTVILFKITKIWEQTKYPLMDEEKMIYMYITSVHSLSRVRLFVTPRAAACQASLSITNSWSLLKLKSIKSVTPSNHLILCHALLLPPSLFPSIRVSSNESVLCIKWPSIGVSASASIFPMNIRDWFPSGWTGWISLQSKGLSRVFSNTTVQ